MDETKKNNEEKIMENVDNDLVEKYLKEATAKDEKTINKAMNIDEEAIQKYKMKVADYLEEEKDDIDQMIKVRDHFIANINNYENHAVYKMAANKIYKADRVAKKALENMSTSPDAKAEADEIRYNEIEKLVGKEDWYYVQTAEKILKYSNDDWIQHNPNLLNRSHEELAFQDSVYPFFEILRNEKRIYETMTYTFKKCPNNVLNLMKRDHWMIPKSGEVHPYMNILLDSLSSGCSEKREHLEHVICRKYLHPEDNQIPCINFFGAGGAGKGVFVNSVLGKIFGQNQVTVENKSKILGNFNGQMKGKTIIMVNEITSNKADMEIFKDLVGDDWYTVNEKGLKTYRADLTALFMTSSNNVLNSIILEGDDVDRRWSIFKIKADQGLKYWMKKHNVSCTINEFVRTLEKNIETWLGNIVIKYNELDTPQAYHGDDYQELLNTQKSELDLMLEDLILDEDFEMITTKDIWNFYTYIMDKKSPSWKGLTENKTITLIDHWVQKNAKDVKQYKKLFIYENGKRVKRNVFIKNKSKIIGKIEYDNSFLLDMKDAKYHRS